MVLFIERQKSAKSFGAANQMSAIPTPCSSSHTSYQARNSNRSWVKALLAFCSLAHYWKHSHCCNYLSHRVLSKLNWGTQLETWNILLMLIEFIYLLSIVDEGTQFDSVSFKVLQVVEWEGCAWFRVFVAYSSNICQMLPIVLSTREIMMSQ